MKQVAQVLRTGEILVVDAPTPLVTPGHVLVRNSYSLVSAGTERSKIEMGRKNLAQKAKARPDLVRQVIDKVRTEGLSATLATVNERLDALSPLGYSTAGTIIGVGEGVVGFKVGQRVACAGAECAYHAEYVLVPQLLCAAVPEGVSDSSAAYTTVGSIAVQGLRQADVSFGDRVLVIGLGLIGQMTAQLARASGCIVAGADVSEEQVARAVRSGFASSVRLGSEGDTERLMEMSGGDGFDRVLITAAAPDNAPVVLAGELARDRARIVFVGATPVEAPRSPFYEKELELVMSRSYGPGRYDPSYELHGHDYPIGYVRWTEQRNMESFLHALSTGAIEVDSLTTHTFDVSSAAAAYDLLADRAQTPVGVLIRYPGSEVTSQPASDASAPSSARASDHERKTRRSGNGVALVGVGNFATKTLLPALKRCGDLVPEVAVSARGLSAADVVRRHGIPGVESDPIRAFGREGVVAAMISTRHDSHAQLTVQALDAGLSVFVEKPLCMRPQELRSVIEAEARAGTVVTVGFNRRFAPATLALRDARARYDTPCTVAIRVDAGAIPLTHWIQDPDVGGGRLVGEGCHFIDLAIAIVGARVVRVAGVAADRGRDARLSDTFQLLLEHADGSTSSVTYVADGSGALGKERVELFCGGMTAMIDDFKQWRITHGTTSVSKRSRQDKGHAAEVAAFCSAVVSGSSVPGLQFEDALHSMLVTFAAAEALALSSAVTVEDYASDILG